MQFGVRGFPGTALLSWRWLMANGKLKERIFLNTSAVNFSLPYMARLLLFGVGGGGGGGGSALTTTWAGSGGGGASLLPFEFILPAGTILSVVAGSAGGGASGSNNGGDGSATTFSISGLTFISIPGGFGGISDSAGSAGGAGGAGTQGIILPGYSGQGAGPAAGYSAIMKLKSILPDLIKFGTQGVSQSASSTQYGGGGSAGYNGSDGGSGKQGFAGIWYQPLIEKEERFI